MEPMQELGTGTTLRLLIEVRTMGVNISFKTNNAAFEDPDEVSSILREIAGNTEAGKLSGSARDANGQPVGKYSVKR